MNWMDRVILDVAELPDRSSPEGEPDVMLVTAGELRAILERATVTKPLTDAELREMRTDCRLMPETEHTHWWLLFARAIENRIMTPNG